MTIPVQQRPILISGDVVEAYEIKNSRQSVKVRFVTVSGERLPVYKRVFGYITFYQLKSNLRKGDRVTSYVKLKPLYRNDNPYVPSKLYRDIANGLRYKGNANARNGLLIAKKPFQSDLRPRWLKDLQVSWLYESLILGDKKNMPTDVRKSLKQTGLSHLFAISGLHMAILFGFSVLILKLMLVPVCGWLSQMVNINIVVNLVALAMCFYYLLISGLAISSMRAFIMLCLFVGNYIIVGRYITTRSIVYALTAIIVINPFNLFNPGLYFSFLAVCAIAVYNKRVGMKKRRFFIRLLYLQLVITLFILPSSWFFMHGISGLSVIMNIVMVPLFSVIILPLLFIVFSFASVGVMYPISMFDSLMAKLFNQMSELNWSIYWIDLPWLGVTNLILVSMIVGILVWLPRWSKLLLFTPLITLISNYALTRYDARITVYDVGHGLAMMIDNGRDAILYDIGAGYGHFSYFSSVLMPNIKAQNLNLVAIILSHNDNDHRGGYADVIAQGYGHLVLNYINDGIVHRCDVKPLSIRNILITQLWPLTKGESRHNNDSCVLKVELGNFRALLTGDIERNTEQMLLSDARIFDMDVLISPHHGSNTSSSYDFVERVNATWVVHSNRRFDRWRLPKTDVVSRYSKLGAKQLFTSSGAVQFTIIGDQYVVTQQRTAANHWFLIN